MFEFTKNMREYRLPTLNCHDFLGCFFEPPDRRICWQSTSQNMDLTLHHHRWDFSMTRPKVCRFVCEVVNYMKFCEAIDRVKLNQFDASEADRRMYKLKYWLFLTGYTVIPAMCESNTTILVASTRSVGFTAFGVFVAICRIARPQVEIFWLWISEGT